MCVCVSFPAISLGYWQAAHSNEDVGSSGAVDEPKPVAAASSAAEAKAEEKEKEKEKETKEKQKKAAAASGGWLPEIFTGMFKKPKNQMKLPDDKNPTVR